MTSSDNTKTEMIIITLNHLTRFIYDYMLVRDNCNEQHCPGLSAQIYTSTFQTRTWFSLPVLRILKNF